jgi:hypothetical protein
MEMTMTNKSKAKGNRNETNVAYYFTKWYGQEFRRMPTSGALRWNNHIWTYGDLLCPEDFLCCIETKTYNEVTIDAILTHGINSYILYWWTTQCLKDAARASKALDKGIHPLLVWRKTRGKIKIAMDLHLFACTPKIVDIPHIIVNYPPHRAIAALLLSDFFKHISPEDFRKATNLEARSYLPDK